MNTYWMRRRIEGRIVGLDKLSILAAVRRSLKVATMTRKKVHMAVRKKKMKREIRGTTIKLKITINVTALLITKEPLISMATVAVAVEVMCQVHHRLLVITYLLT